ncbi:CG15719 [Drosophila busckii]|uniref:CG15719 n=1 Tax=Drosophila busckii TaxID=30019 RepID=A0A0M3QYZ0_DROBS|nr:V-type proton ATPase subunit F [Drosophila busckii]ALC48513.1 CG15719 [Drosophila busckii]
MANHMAAVSEEFDADEAEDKLVDEPEDPSIVRIGVIADTEVTLGLLLVGIGYERDKFHNYLMVDNDTPLDAIEQFFQNLYKRHNIGIILIDFMTAKRLGTVLDKCKKLLPVVVILPTKASIVPYIEEKERLRRQRRRDIYL